MEHVAPARKLRIGGRLLLPVLALAVSGCMTTGDSPPLDNNWAMASQSPQPRPAPVRPPPVITTAPDPAARPEATSYFNGTGRFIGEQQDAAPAATSRSGDTVTLNLVNVSVPQAAKTVLNDILAVKYTVDPAIEGKVTIQTPAPVQRQEAVELFQSALRANNAAMIDVGGSYRIVPVELASVGANLRLGGGTQREPLGSRVQVVQLKYVSAAEIRRVLEPISPRGSILQVDGARNTITLSGNGQEIANMLDAISVFDIDVMKGMSFALVPVKTSQPDAIVDDLRAVFASNSGPMAGMVRFIPNRQLSAVLVISPQPTYLTRAEEWVRRFDARAAGTEKQFYTYPVQNRRAHELVAVLQSVFSNETGGARATGAPRNVAPQLREANAESSSALSGSFQRSGMGGGGMGGGGIGGGMGGGGLQSGGMQGGGALSQNRPGQTGFGATQSGLQPAAPPPDTDTRAAPQAGGPDPAAEPRIRLALDEGKNAILIQASPADYKRVQRVLYSLDVMPTQVLIEVTIAEVTLNDQLKFGVRWFLQNNGSSVAFTDAISGSVRSVFPGFSYALALTNVTAAINALNQITDVNVISSPSLTVMDHKTAVLQIGDEVPITTGTSVSTLAAGAPIVSSVSYKDTGVILAMTPRINASGRILLDLEQEVSTVVPTTSSGIDSPTIRQRRIKTSVVVNNGEALALGGLIQNNQTLARTRIPIVGDIPLIGNAFKSKDNQLNKTELIIVITPHLMRNVTEARLVTDDFRNELATFSAPPLRPSRNVPRAVQRTFE